MMTNLKNLIKNNKKPIIIWGVTFGIVLVVGFSILAIALGTQKVSFGMAIAAADVSFVKYAHPDHSKEMHADSGRESYDETIAEILRLLDNAGRTNKFKQIFGQAGGKEQIQNRNNTSSNVSSSERSFKTYIEIEFKQPPPLAVNGSNNDDYELVDGGSTSDAHRDVWMLIIPLDGVKNKFERHTWYLVTYNTWRYNDPSIRYQFVTYGNYHKLAEYITELKVL